MRPLPTILFCVLLTGLAAALKKCDDCDSITECAPAFQLIRKDRSQATAQKLQSSLCGFDVNGVQKVCCSDFLLTQYSNDEKEDENSAQTVGDDIENHRNVHLLPTECGDIDGDRIVGGTSADLYEFPWMALISYRDDKGRLKFKCGGTVITARYVLTAAHCIANRQVIGVRIGDYDISQAEDCVGEEEIRECETKYQDITISHKIHHPEYFRGLNYAVNDIGLLRLTRPVNFTPRNSGAICLPIMMDMRNKNLEGETGTVAGWGMTETGNKSNILLKVDVPIFSQNTCNVYYKSASKRGKDRMINTLCAGEQGRDSCNGDSGGPLMLGVTYNYSYKFVQFGIVSYGSSQCGNYKPGVYTDVRKFMKWILDTIKP